MSEQKMCYVAADPTQPGSAWAAIVDLPHLKKDLAKEVSAWIKQGAEVKRVTADEAREMLLKWTHPDDVRNSDELF